MWRAGCVAGAISEEQYVQGLRDAGLGDVQVTDRITYDASQVSEFIASELPASEQGQACGGAPVPEAGEREAHNGHQCVPPDATRFTASSSRRCVNNGPSRVS